VAQKAYNDIGGIRESGEMMHGFEGRTIGDCRNPTTGWPAL
jgi:hypothetical protein